MTMIQLLPRLPLTGLIFLERLNCCCLPLFTALKKEFIVYVSIFALSTLLHVSGLVVLGKVKCACLLNVLALLRRVVR